MSKAEGSFSIGANGKGRRISQFFTGHNGYVVVTTFQGPDPGSIVTIGLDPEGARRLASELIAQSDRMEAFQTATATQT